MFVTFCHKNDLNLCNLCELLIFDDRTISVLAPKQSNAHCTKFTFCVQSWQAMPELQSPRYDFNVVWLPDGRIFAIGGFSGAHLRSVEMLVRNWAFSGLTETSWRHITPMKSPRSDFAVVVWRDVVLVAGGNSETIELLTPPALSEPRARGQWTEIRLIESPLCGCTGALSDGNILIFGA